MRTYSKILACCVVLVSGCGDGSSWGGGLDVVGSSVREGLTLSRVELQRLLHLLNDPRTTSSLLIELAGVHPQTVSYILAYRNGVDGLYPSADDRRFASLDDIDAIDSMGPIAMGKVLTFLRDQCQHRPSLVEGVKFSASQAEAVVWGINTEGVDYLDTVVGLDRRAAENLVSLAPYTLLAQLEDIFYIGPVAMQLLKAHCQAWEIEHATEVSQSQAGIYHGVDFQEATARQAFEYANAASPEFLHSAGLWQEDIQLILKARPFTHLVELAESDGIGATVMQALQSLALPQHAVSLDDAVSPS
jgi:hypothetical protein